MITAFVKAYWKQLLIVSMLAALVAGGVVARIFTVTDSTTPGMRRRRLTAKQKMRKPVNMMNRRKQPMNVRRSRGSTGAQ